MGDSSGRSRRVFLGDLGVAAWGGLSVVGGGWLASSRSASGVAAVSSDEQLVSVLHTTDLHGHILPTTGYDGQADVGGLARCASQLRAWQQQNPASLLLDAGDLFQGTAAGYLSRGRVMVDLLNQLGYDAWSLGNHDFDWGSEVWLEALAASQMPVLTANLAFEGRAAGTLEPSHPLAKVRPWMIRELGGFRIGLLGLITPGLSAWLTSDQLGAAEVTDPVAAAARSVAELKGEGVDAIVAVVHFGWRDQDDHANPLQELAYRVPEIDLIIGGHTHRLHESRQVGRSIYTQANYHGLHCGRVDLVFDLQSRRLLGCRPMLASMDAQVPFDPLVMQVAAPVLEQAEQHLEQVVGELAEPLDYHYHLGTGGPTHRLIASSMLHAAAKRGHPAEVVFHGTFSQEPIAAGPITQRQLWQVLPYENSMVRAELTYGQLVAILEEAMGVYRSDQVLCGLVVETERRGSRTVVSRLSWPDGRPLEPGRRVGVLINSYDAQSGGRRLMQLRAILEEPAVRGTVEYLPVQTRHALTDFLVAHRPLRLSDLVAG